MRSSSFNNMLVRSLQSGDANALCCLISLGLNPLVDIDLINVSDDALSNNVTDLKTNSIWFWIHQSSNPGGVTMAWKSWVPSFVSSSSQQERNENMKKLFVDSLEAAISSQNYQSFLTSWEGYFNWSTVYPQWTQEVVSNIFQDVVLKYGDSAVPLLNLLNGEAIFNKKDSVKFFGKPGNLETVIRNGSSELFQFLLDTSGPITPAVFQNTINKVDARLHQIIQANPSDFFLLNEGGQLSSLIEMYESLKMGLNTEQFLPKPNDDYILKNLKSNTGCLEISQLLEIFLQRDLRSSITPIKSLKSDRF